MVFKNIINFIKLKKKKVFQTKFYLQGNPNRAANIYK